MKIAEYLHEHTSLSQYQVNITKYSAEGLMLLSDKKLSNLPLGVGAGPDLQPTDGMTERAAAQGLECQRQSETSLSLGLVCGDKSACCDRMQV